MEKKKEKKQKILIKITVIAIVSVILISTILTVIGVSQISGAYKSMTNEELKATADHLRSQMNSTWDGDWGMDESGAVTKGGEPVTDEYQKLMANWETLLKERYSETVRSICGGLTR